MRVHRLFIVLFILLLLAMSLPGQNDAGENLERLRQNFATEMSDRNVRIQAYLAAQQLPARWQVQENFIEIVDVQNNRPLYYTTCNASAAQSIGIDKVRLLNSPSFQFTGQGFQRAAIWDSKGVLTTHQEFDLNNVSRVIQKDSPSGVDNHPTHCAGSMIAAGVRETARGMAPAAQLFAYDWTSDSYEMTMAAGLDELLVSNHSYGVVAGWTLNSVGEWFWFGNPELSETEDYMFGLYDAIAKNWDAIAYNAPNYLIVKAAGNDAGQGPSRSTGPPNDGGDDGFDTLVSAAVAKNVLTVGAVFDVDTYSIPDDAQIVSYSARGPADDGRIKPDVVTNGYFVVSSTSSTNEAYGVTSGTSMASANMSGAVILLQDYYLHLHNQPMRSATVKALVIQTADECGDFPGPDYVYGWGLVNMKRAIDMITADQSSSVISEGILSDGEIKIIPIRVFGNEPLKATLVWTDPPGTPTDYLVDPPDRMLVNNLDLEMTQNSNGSRFLPFTLDPLNPTAQATRAENNTDNVEQILVENPVSGEYTVSISHKDALLYGSQRFSLLVSGASFDVQAPQKVSGVTVDPL